MNLQTGEIRNGTYFKQWWQEMPPATKKRWRVFLLVFMLFWLGGALYTPAVVAGIARLTGLARVLMSLGMGGFGFLWGFLKEVNLIHDTIQEPNLFWLVLALAMPGTLFGFLYLLNQTPNPLFGMQKMVEQMGVSQGRLHNQAVVRQLAIERGVPVATVTDERNREVRVGLDYATGEGHLIVSAPTRGGKGLHATETLLTWPGPALVVDPKGEQLARTAAWRSQFGPVYCLPGHQVNLAEHYGQMLDRDDLAELHTHLMRPWESRETIFAEKALSLFTAAGLYAQAKGLNPVRVLLDLAESDAEEALAGLESVPAVKRHVRVFTNGARPEAYRDDRFVTSAFGNFTTRLATYQKHIDTIAPPDAGSYRVVDADWVQRGGTLYITYSLQDLKGVGGVVAAVIAAMLRRQMRRNTKERLLVAIDELPVVGLRNIADYLATCGGYAITLLLYVQSIAQLKTLYGAEGTNAILSNCAHQLWYPPTEHETAVTMSRLYGITLRANPAHSSSRGARRHTGRDGQAQMQTNQNLSASWSWQERPELLPSQIMALPREQVLVSTLAGRQRLVFLGKRLNPIPLFENLPPESLLRLPRPRYGERVYTSWLEVTAPPAATEAPAISAHPPTPVEAPTLDDKDDAAETRPSADNGSPDSGTTTGSAAKDAI